MRLMKFREKDAPLFRQLVFNEEAMRRSFGRPFSEAEAKAFFRAALAGSADDAVPGFYKVMAAPDGQEACIGTAELNGGEEPGVLEIEMMLLTPYWNRGFGTELVRRLVARAGEAQGCARVTAITDPGNLPSQRVLRKNGFQPAAASVNEDGEPVLLFERRLDGKDASALRRGEEAAHDDH